MNSVSCKIRERWLGMRELRCGQNSKARVCSREDSLAAPHASLSLV
ncbi:MAG: hypothetical protein SFZ23_10635 [Planctomycetota bacterium]|nr:hypothetical protein [Planctomycetota bacterium]